MPDPLIEELLGLSEFEVTDFKQNEHDAGFYVRRKLRPSVCPVCGVVKAVATRDAWFEVYTQMKTAYDLKEAFFRMYDCQSRHEAERYFYDWLGSIPKDTDYNGWRMIVKKVKRFRTEISNYFDYPYTNAFVEGLNSVIRAIAYNGRGYDFDILRGKVLFSAGRKIATPDTDFNFDGFYDKKARRDYGVPFDNISRAIKKGFLK